MEQSQLQEYIINSYRRGDSILSIARGVVDMYNKSYSSRREKNDKVQIKLKDARLMVMEILQKNWGRIYR